MTIARTTLLALLLLSAPAHAQTSNTDGGRQSRLNITAATVVKPASGRIATFSVTTAGAAGAIHDTTTTAAAAAGNLIAVIPAVAGVYVINWPVLNGIVVVPGAAQVVSVSYE